MVFPVSDALRLLEEMTGAPGPGRRVRGIPLDLHRAGERYLLHLDLPGVDPSTIEVSVQDRALTIRAERPQADADVQWLVRERPTGTYERRLTLGKGVSDEGLEASYQDGVLTVSIPVAEQDKPRRVEVTHAGTTKAGTASS